MAEGLLVTLSAFVIGLVATSAAYVTWLQWEYFGAGMHATVAAALLAMVAAAVYMLFRGLLSDPEKMTRRSGGTAGSAVSLN